MNDTISARIRRIITGTASSIVSKIEGLAPEAILEKAIEEVDEAIDEVRVELGRVTAQKHHVSKAMTQRNQDHEALEEQIRVAMAQGRTELAEVGLGRQVDIEDQLPALASQLSLLSTQETELNQSITGLVAKRNEMEDELFHFRESQARNAAERAVTVGLSNGATTKADRADRAFTRVLEDATGVRRISMKTSRADSASLVELANLSRRAKIDAKLNALKQEQQKPALQ